MTSKTDLSSENCDYFAIEGTVDSSSERYFNDLPSRVRHNRVRLDFAKAGRINSMGVALLLRCLKEIRDNNVAVTLEGLAPMHSMLFKMTGVFLLATPVPAVNGSGGVR